MARSPSLSREIEDVVVDLAVPVRLDPMQSGSVLVWPRINPATTPVQWAKVIKALRGDGRFVVERCSGMGRRAFLRVERATDAPSQA